MRKNIRIVIITIVIAGLLGSIVGLYLFFMPPGDLEKEKPEYLMSPDILMDEFNANEDSSNLKYNNKVIQISGKVIEVNLENNGASLVFVNSIGGVTCAFDSTTFANDHARLSKIKVGDSLTIKGRCDGYDMILGVLLSKSVLIKE